MFKVLMITLSLFVGMCSFAQEPSVEQKMQPLVSPLILVDYLDFTKAIESIELNLKETHTETGERNDSLVAFQIALSIRHLDKENVLEPEMMFKIADMILDEGLSVKEAFGLIYSPFLETFL